MCVLDTVREWSVLEREAAVYQVARTGDSSRIFRSQEDDQLGNLR